ncbi:23S rRNA pseudouridine(2604) synthase RluF [Paraglaciecola agarilytica]|uniref:23S rRNA pseudouridine(2604) synthase RluF n=1 Tax=Paraglaciecola chathamensis TaxID=368405 RepID=UPI001C0806F9|nr:23S rRNA pseudouridine(2604) synthase RluF [Paraglaciecola agarilytica]MBU3016430.1 23S rRNA pseudouridine(2604) synthase RluF [Paraglaciecola agarilytica]
MNTSNTTSSSIRLNKFISDSGFCSRREADKLIDSNRVTINGVIPELGTKVLPGDEVRVDGNLVKASAENKSDRVYLAYHKPVGITCTTERHVKGNIIDAIGHRQRIFPIGRLDKPSEGLIFLTSDGDIVNKILRAENAHDKEYIVTVDRPLTERFIQAMAAGVPILDTVTKPCTVTMQSKFVFRIILTQGLNRQIRRMCEYLGYGVTKLKRSRIMSIRLAGLKVGQWRNLTPDEMHEINSAVAGSTKTAEDAKHKTDTAVPDKRTNHVAKRSGNRGLKSDRGPERSQVRKHSTSAKTSSRRAPKR